MAILQTTKRPAAASKNRYPNKDDAANWTVKGPQGTVKFSWQGKAPHEFASNVYTEVEHAARVYTAETGLFAQPVRV